MRKSNEVFPRGPERAVRMVYEHRGEYPSQWAAIESIAAKIGCMPETLRGGCAGEVDTGVREASTTAERSASRNWSARSRELRRANEILKLASAFFAQAELDRRSSVNAFIDEHRARYGVEPICSALQVAPSAYRRHAARQRNPALRRARAQRDAVLMPQIERVCRANLQVYGADKVWRQMQPRRHGRGALHGRAPDARSACTACAAARWCAPPCPTPRRRVRWIRSTGSSRPSGRTSCGWRTSPTSRPGRASCTWPSSSTSSPGASSAGGSAVDAHRLRARRAGAGAV